MRRTSSLKDYIYIYKRFKGYEIIRWCGGLEGGGKRRK